MENKINRYRKVKVFNHYIFDSPKIEYTLRTIKSVIRSCEIAKRSFKDINIKIIISDDNSNQENLDKINQILQSTNIETKIISIKDIPRTKNGKIVELAVKNIIEGNEIKNKEIDTCYNAKNMLYRRKHVITQINT